MNPTERWVEPGGNARLRALAWIPERPAGFVGIVHGLGDHAGRYEHLARALAGRGFSAESIDLPGHGRSTGPRGHVGAWSAYGEAMDAWVGGEARSVTPRARALVGHSLGALVVLDWALAHPDELGALVLSAPPFGLVLRPNMLKVRVAQLLARFWPGFSQNTGILPTMLTRDPEMIAAHDADPLVHYAMSARLFLEFERMRRQLARRAPEVALPTLVIHGGEDPIASSDASARWAASAQGGRVTHQLYPGFLHETLHEIERSTVVQQVTDWIDATLAPQQ